ncbi:MAG: phosphonoacetaldehyde hydrolase [Phycisphaeraceae bacterium]
MTRSESSFPIKALIVDWAGTVVDFGSLAPVASFMQVFRDEGVPISIAQAREPMGLHKRDHIRALTRMPAVAAAWRARHDHDCDERDVDRMYEAFVPAQLAALDQHSDLIPGLLPVVFECRSRGMKIGSTTGYAQSMIDKVSAAAREQGFEPDSIVCGTDAPIGRPAPWMALEAARRMNVFPMNAIVKIDDTIAGIHEGRNAGMWTIGVTATGNEVGLSESDFDHLPPTKRAELLDGATKRMLAAGADFVVPSIADILPILDQIAARGQGNARSLM